MELNTFVRRPFIVEALEITEENMEVIAELIGSIRTKGSTRYISVDRRIVPNITRAYVGWWLTVIGENYRCYSPKLFKALFIEHSPVMAFSFDDGKLSVEERATMAKEALRTLYENDVLEAIVPIQRL